MKGEKVKVKDLPAYFCPHC
ncbi:MAG: YgiT-type zinc finger protein [Agriterribacter sp.]